MLTCFVSYNCDLFDSTIFHEFGHSGALTYLNHKPKVLCVPLSFHMVKPLVDKKMAFFLFCATYCYA